MTSFVAGSRLLVRSFNSAISALASASAGGGGTRKSWPDEITHVFQLPAFGSICSAASAAAGTASNKPATTARAKDNARMAFSLLLDKGGVYARAVVPTSCKLPTG